ncbi:MAG TPA: hypothetical protein VFI22_19410 [Thermomicrobiales bacterium]|nr:hypothetical protein [Thermomicrobiales bacterium]
MFGRPRGARAAHPAKPARIGTWRALAALALIVAAVAGGGRWDGGARADAPIGLIAPGADVAIPAGQTIRFAWKPLAAAAAYRVEFGDGERTGPWVETTFWESGSLPPGRYRWRVAARTADGLAWSDARAFRVGASDPGGVLTGLQAATPAASAARLELAAGSVIVGTRLTVTGTGFAPGEAVDFVWERAGEAAPEHATAGDDGGWTTPVLVPEIPGGAETLAARGETSGVRARAPLAILPSLERTPAAGSPGAEIVVSLRGFAANEHVELRWGDDERAIATALTHTDGSARIRFAIPDAATDIGALIAVGQSSGDRASATLRVDPTAASEPDATPAAPERPTIGSDQSIGPGSFAVQAAPDGADAGATSGGHAIAASDHFAALPICVTTSCPWLDPGVNHPLWGVRVECGAACFVRVTNPASGRCVVAPVLDVGPWFSDDDWWSAAPRRRINRLDGAVYSLAAGYAAAAAARDGYDVGFGLSPNGVGISDRGYEVGNGAALGLAAGSWADLGFAPDQGVADVEATLLWLTNDDPKAAAAACDAGNAALPDAALPAPPSPSASPPGPATPVSGAAEDPATNEPAAAPEPDTTSVTAPPASPAAPPEPTAVGDEAVAAGPPSATENGGGGRHDASRKNDPADDRGHGNADSPRSDPESRQPDDRKRVHRDDPDRDHGAGRSDGANSVAVAPPSS